MPRNRFNGRRRKNSNMNLKNMSIMKSDNNAHFKKHLIEGEKRLKNTNDNNRNYYER